MTIAIMQPYFLPYIGYFQLIKAVDKFVFYDDIEFTKKGWIHRNRMLQNGADVFFTLPLKRDSDYLDIFERSLADNYISEKQKILSRIKNNYLKAPYFHVLYPIVEEIFDFENHNLFDFVLHSIRKIMDVLDINTEVIISSSLGKDIRHLKGKEKVIEINKQLTSKTYINAIGGKELYNKEEFGTQGIELQFIQSKPIKYTQFNNEFVPWLSILDVLMFNSKDKVKEMLDQYELV